MIFYEEMELGASLLIYLVPLARVERAAHGLGIRCSILLSYRGNRIYGSFCGLTCFPGGVNDERLLPTSEAESVCTHSVFTVTSKSSLIRFKLIFRRPERRQMAQ